MANQKVTLVRLCKTEDGWKRYPAVIGKTGKVKPHAVRVGDDERVYKEGQYQIRFYEGKKTVYEPAGDDPTSALNARDRKERLLTAERAASEAGIGLDTGGDKRVRVADAAVEFLEKVELSSKNSGLSKYRITIERFQQCCPKTFVDQVEKMDVLRFVDYTRKRGYSERTVWNNTNDLFSFFRYCGLDPKKMVSRNERPVFPDSPPESYTDEQMAALFAACDNDLKHKVLYETLVKTGPREQEAMFLEWADIDFGGSVLKIVNKPSLGFRIKTYQGREIHIEKNLLATLRKWRKLNPNKRFVFGTKNDRPDTKLLRGLKRFVHKHGLSCGKCESCKKYHECEKWYLHKFRATFATKLLHEGLDLHTLMKLMGHAEIASTMRYLSAARTESTKAKLDQIFGGVAA